MREIRTSGSEEGSAEVTQQIYSNRSLAGDFLRINQLIDQHNEGNETHYAVALFNFVAHAHGLAEEVDPLAPQFDLDLLDAYRQFVEKQLNVAALVRVLPQFLPAIPPPGNIMQQTQFDTLNDFFQSLGEEKPGSKQYWLLYTEEDIDDVPAYVPRKDWDVVYASVLAYYLEKAGYISGAQITIGNKKLLDNSEHIIDASNDTFALLKDDDAECLSQLLLQNPNMLLPEVWRIIKQIPTVHLLDSPYAATHEKTIFLSSCKAI